MAINLKSLKPNKPRANLEDYVFTIYGIPKSGKTTLFSKLIKKVYGDVSKGLLIGFEKGYQALEIMAQDINDWSDFVEIVDQLIEKRDELGFKFVGIDTADEMYNYATKEVIRQRRIEDRKPYKVIGDIPYGQGYDQTDKLVKEQLARIQKNGLGLMFISHNVDKKFQSRDGQEYDKTTLSLPTRARNTVLNMSDFILYIDVAKEKDENDRLQDVRYIYFRADGSDLEAGSRFANVPNRIPYDVDEFVKTFENAVINAFTDEKVDITKVKKEQKQEREKKAKKYIEQEHNDAEKIKEKILQKIDNWKREKKVEFASKLKEDFGNAKFNDFDDVDKLQKVLKIATDMS